MTAENKIAEGAALHRAKSLVEGGVRPDDELQLHSGAERVGQMAVAVRESFGTTEHVRHVDALEAYITQRLKGKRVGGGEYGNFRDLRGLVESVDNGTYTLDPDEEEDYDDLWNLYADIVDGFALAAIFQPNLSDDLRTAVEGNDTGGVDAVFGVVSGSSLNGVANLVIETAITDNRLLKRLGILNKAVGSGRDIFEVFGDADKAIQNMIDNDVVDYDQAVMVLSYINYMVTRIVGERVREKAKGTEIPASKDEQLAMVRAKLDYVESLNLSTDLMDLTSRQYVADLENMANQGLVLPEVAGEIKARVHLLDCYAYMKRAGGWISAPESGADPMTPTIGAAIARARSIGHLLEREDMVNLLDGKLNGIPVHVAWNMIEDANYFYGDVLERAADDFHLTGKERDIFLKAGMEVAVDDEEGLGLVETNFYSDGDGARKEIVKAYIVAKIAREREVDVKIAAKAFDLADKLALATLETSVFNRAAMTGNDELAEDIGLFGYREGRQKKGRNRGPEIHIHKIKGIGTSWLRYVSRRDDVDRPIYAEDIHLHTIPAESLAYYGPVWVSGKIHPLRGLLLDREPDPKKYKSKELLQRAVDYFDKADPRVRIVELPSSTKKGKRYGVVKTDEYVVVGDKEYQIQVDTRKKGEKLKPEHGRKYVLLGDKKIEVVLEYQGGRYNEVIEVDGETIRLSRRDYVDFDGKKHKVKDNVVDFGGRSNEVVMSKDGIRGLKRWWIAGVLQMAITNSNLGWTQRDIAELYIACVRESLSEERGSFITPEQWDAIADLLQLSRRMFSLEIERERVASAQGMLRSLGGVVKR